MPAKNKNKPITLADCRHYRTEYKAKALPYMDQDGTAFAPARPIAHCEVTLSLPHGLQAMVRVSTGERHPRLRRGRPVPRDSLVFMQTLDGGGALDPAGKTQPLTMGHADNAITDLAARAGVQVDWDSREDFYSFSAHDAADKSAETELVTWFYVDIAVRGDQFRLDPYQRKAQGWRPLAELDRAIVACRKKAERRAARKRQAKTAALAPQKPFGVMAVARSLVEATSAEFSDLPGLVEQFTDLHMHGLVPPGETFDDVLAAVEAAKSEKGAPRSYVLVSSTEIPELAAYMAKVQEHYGEAANVTVLAFGFTKAALADIVAVRPRSTGTTARASHS